MTVFFLQKLLLPGAVETAVFGLINFAFIEQALQEIAHHPLVPLLRRADEIIIGNMELHAQFPKFRADFVRELLRRDAARPGSLLDFLPVFIGACEKKHLVSHQPPETRNDVRQHLFVGMAEVRRTVYIIDGGGQVK